ncbi:MAG: prolipoprotein diacylglyceryl transferase [Actinobacteria bacterium]|nr:prolipoprotein diacylglyceryl transferase [Actinomycetota bacterium]
MYPEIKLGPLTIQTFGLMIALAFVAAGAIVARRLREFGKPTEWAYEIVLAAAAGGLIGAKLWYSLQQGDWSFGQLLSGSGLVWYGGALGGTGAVCLYAHRRGMLDWTIFDLCTPALAAGYAIGRIGCQLSGDGDYGKSTDAWWGMGYPDGTVPTPPGVKVYPTPVIETLSMGLLAFVLWRLRDRYRPGVLFGLYLVASSAERFLIEFLRRNEVVAVGLTLAQIVSAGLAALGVAIVLSLRDDAGARARPVSPPQA